MIKNKIILFTIGFILTLIISELFLSFTKTIDKTVNTIDTELGVHPKAGTSFVKFNEGFSVGKYNEHGYLGPAYTFNKPNNTIRIALLGDSFIEGTQLVDRSHLRSKIESELKLQLNKNIEVLNFGRSGFCFSDMYMYHKNIVTKYSPDYTIFFISSGDVYTTNSGLNIPQVKIYNDTCLTITTISEPRSIERLSYFLTRNSSVLSLANRCVKILKEIPLLNILAGSKVINSKQNPKTNTSKKVPMLSKLIIKNLNPDNTIIINRGLKKIDGTFVNIIHTSNIQYSDISSLLNNKKNSTNNPYYWNVTGKKGHWNYSGHSMVSRIVTDKLVEIINMAGK